MPTQAEWTAAVAWALTQKDHNGNAITSETPMELVSAVREYLNAHGIAYGTFAFADLTPYLPA